jgi:sulfur transfer protein SufE
MGFFSPTHFVQVEYTPAEANAREYKIKFNNTKDRKLVLMIENAEVTVSGYNGDEVVIEATGLEQAPKRAEGLKALYNTVSDNTGIGLAVTQENNVIRFEKATRKEARYSVKIPKNTSLVYEEVNWHGNNDLRVSDLEGNVEVSLNNSSAFLTNISGAVDANTTNGNIDVVFTNLSQQKSSSVRSVNGHIDVALPDNTKASYKLHTVNGEVYSDFEVETKEKNGLRKVSGGDRIVGSTNGGGISMDLSSVNSDIFLRKRK